MINAKLQSIIDTKSAIGNAITNKGGTITTNTPFFNYAAQIDGISTGTPQTIFQASDGSKWALTNAVNLVNDAGNVTSDFNYWQPANNSTSDPILNIGTVGANISGNIKLVPVNQVNIAQYENIVINDTTGAKYVGYNGYDSQTNPTPTGNITFNRWLLNNAASGTIVFANTIISNGGTFNGPNSTVNITNMAFINKTASYGGSITGVKTNNGFIFVVGDTNRTVQKFGESNLVRVANSINYGGDLEAVLVNDSFVFIAGSIDQTIKRYHESNLAFVNNSVSYGGTITSLALNNAFIYAGGSTNQTIQKFHESNLTRATGTNVSNSYGGSILALTTNNGFIYAGGTTNQTVQKFEESNLVRVGNTNSYGGAIRSITTNNGFIYVGGATNQTVQKFYESNLAFVGNTAAYGGDVRCVKTNGGFIFASGFDTIKKYYESNLAFVAETNNYSGTIINFAINNGFTFSGGTGDNTTHKHQEQGLSAETLTFYTATKIKE
jgi:hypothetical protein